MGLELGEGRGGVVAVSPLPGFFQFSYLGLFLYSSLTFRSHVPLLRDVSFGHLLLKFEIIELVLNEVSFAVSSESSCLLMVE